MTRLLATAAALLGLAGPAPALDLDKAEGAVRVATFNVALAREGAGLLIRDFGRDDRQIANVVEIILHLRPDILLVNELDADPEGRALALFQARLAEGAAGLPGLDMPHSFQGPQNIGEFSGLDLDGDGKAAGPRDAWGFGRFPGQYAMAVLSRLPIDEAAIRSYRLFPWSAMPDARRPTEPDGRAHHPDAIWQALRLSSKSHWDVPVTLPDGRRLHLLAAHPTPPVFDGPEDLNGRRNADEIRLLRAMIEGPDWLIDDTGRAAGIDPGTPFVVAGDLNADPVDGDGHRDVIAGLLADPRLTDPRQSSPGGAAAKGGRSPERIEGDPGLHTSDWGTAYKKLTNLRVDYVLPSAGLEITGHGVFWPAPGDPLARLTKRTSRRTASSDHRPVWVDIR